MGGKKRPESTGISQKQAKIEDTLRQTLAARLKAEREAKKLTLEALAEAMRRAGAAALGGDAERACADLQRATDVSDKCDMTVIGAVARRYKGTLVGGDEGQSLVAAATAVFDREAIGNSAAFCAMYAPGFDES